MKEKILFISKYSKENLFLAEEICSNSGSMAFFWENEELNLSKNNYFDILDYSNLPENFFIISEKIDSENFILTISNILLKNNCNLVVTAGSTFDIWPIALAKSHFLLNNIPFVTVLENLNNLQEFDKNILKQFDYILGMGPNCFVDEFKEKIEILFKEKDMSMYKDFSFKRKEGILLLCNKHNIKEHIENFSSSFEEISFLDPSHCDDQELSILLNLSKIVVDDSQNFEVNLILKKIGIKNYSLKDLLEKKHNILFEKEDNFYTIERKKSFFNHLGKEIELRLKKLNYSPIVEGTEISLGE